MRGDFDQGWRRILPTGRGHADELQGCLAGDQRVENVLGSENVAARATGPREFQAQKTLVNGSAAESRRRDWERTDGVAAMVERRVDRT